MGSVKSVYTDESRGFVLSGSYDTTIRYIYGNALFISTVQYQRVGFLVRAAERIQRPWDKKERGGPQ